MSTQTPAQSQTASPEPAEETGDASFLESLIGPSFFQTGLFKRLRKLTNTQFVLLMAVLFGALLYIPYLGAVGLWDPWETHYGEVGREMIQRNDYVYPWWESAWFFSKPPLTMWMQALGMQIVGTNRTPGALALYTEWGMRLPFAIFAISAVALMTLALSRVLNRRIAFAAMFALCTMPLYFLLTRQTVTDTPFVSCFISAMACALIAQFDGETRHRTAWWYGFYVFSGLGLLAKELIGIGFPGAVLLIYALFFKVPWRWGAISEHIKWLGNPDNVASIFLSDFEKFRKRRTAPPALWQQFFDMRLLTGILVAFAVCVPWLVALSLFEGVDDESKTFFYRFFIHDNINRLFAGVHTTTPGGDFTYFIQQGGFAIFPWVALVPGALVVASRIKLRSLDKEDHVAFIAVAWVAFTFFLFSSSATKFHHYVFPVLPGLAILIGIYIDRLWKEGIGAHLVPLIFGFVLFVLVAKDLIATPKDFTDLFVYNYDRPYPQELVDNPLHISDAIKPIKWLSMDVNDGPLLQGHVLALVLLLLGGYQLLEIFFPTGKKKAAAAGPWTMDMGILCASLGISLLIALRFQAQVSASLLLGLAFAAGGLAIFATVNRFPEIERTSVTTVGAAVAGIGLLLVLIGLNRGPAQDPLRSLITDSVNIKDGMKFLFAVGGLMAVLGLFWRARTMAFGSFGVMTLLFALWFNWSHWVDLSHHWTQRDQFWRYYGQKKPGEPITAFLMNWRGETFYSKNTVKQIKDNSRLTAYANQPGREWALVEHYRFGILKAAVGADKIVTPINPELNNKFVLVTIDKPNETAAAQ
ncbi:MAG: ArnT family glycosyltransferase [Myxococcaceae bacterium]